MKITISNIGALVLLFIFFLSCNKTNNPPPPPPQPTNPYKVSTYAGNGVPGFADGPSQSAQFGVLGGLVVDALGILYIADQVNRRIRMVALDSSVSTFAGTGVEGYLDGPAASAQFYLPADVAFDTQGNLIVADIGNNRIRKISAAGIVSTVAGDGTQGYLDGNVSVAKFNQPNAVCIDISGNIYVSDQGNARIRKISISGEVTTVAGNGNRGFVNGNALSAEFDLPFDIEIDSQGNLYVADLFNDVIRKISNAGIVSTYAGTGEAGFADGTLTTAKFWLPSGLILDAQGNLYVSDQENHRIRKISSSGMVSTIAGKGTAGHANGNADSAQFAQPKGIALTNQGIFYIGDRLTYRIKKISK